MLKQKSIFLVVAFMTFQVVGYGWELNYNYFNNNLSLFNPAAASIKTKVLTSASYRLETTSNEWGSNYRLDHAVSTNVEFLSTKLKGGVGIGFLNDFIYERPNNRYYLNYGYQKQLGESTMSLGLGAFYHQVGRDINTDTGPSKKYQDKLNLNIGAYFHHAKFDAGISISRLNRPRYYDGHIDALYRVDASLIANGSYHKLIHTNFEWKIDGLLQVISRNANLFVRNTVTYQDVLWAGFGLSSSGALSGQVGGKVYKKISIGYSYQGDSYANSYFYQAHEVCSTYRVE